MAKQLYGKSKANTSLWVIGVWATVWWGVSGCYVLLLVWLGKAELEHLNASNGFWSDWHSAITAAYRKSELLPMILALILIVWVVGGYLWLRELKRKKISYKLAFKDLFLTIRK